MLYFLMLDRFSDGTKNGYEDDRGKVVTSGKTIPKLSQTEQFCQPNFKIHLVITKKVILAIGIITLSMSKEIFSLSKISIQVKEAQIFTSLLRRY
ncbi:MULTISPECIES: hypothetical protein [unclassified Microcoleus]|uniref:hypothetical protein n=2 Tax=unclassified Microcoleus TaxID=2642155 RepID=UPI0025CD069B|nr:MULTISPECIES: hypothetical protein [unclassified Microcoleus]